jgi:hypothetical protein
MRDKAEAMPIYAQPKISQYIYICRIRNGQNSKI